MYICQQQANLYQSIGNKLTKQISHWWKPNWKTYHIIHTWQLQHINNDFLKKNDWKWSSLNKIPITTRWWHHYKSKTTGHVPQAIPIMMTHAKRKAYIESNMCEILSTFIPVAVCGWVVQPRAYNPVDSPALRFQTSTSKVPQMTASWQAGGFIGDTHKVYWRELWNHFR